MLSLTTLDQAVSNIDASREQYNNYAKIGVYIWMHPGWGAFADTDARPPSFPNSKNLLEDYIKKCLLEVPRKETQIEALEEYSEALQYLNEITFFSALRETQPLVLLALPKEYYIHALPSEEYYKNQDPIRQKEEMHCWFFPQEYEDYIEQATGNLPNFIVFETTSYDWGEVSRRQINNLSTLFRQLEVSSTAIIGGNVNWCLNSFVETIKPELPDVWFLAIADLCYTLPDELFWNNLLLSEEPLWKTYSLIDFVKEKISYCESSIKEYNLEELQQFIYSFPVLNHKLNPEERVWVEESGKPDLILSADQIESPSIDKFREIVSESNRGNQTEPQIFLDEH